MLTVYLRVIRQRLGIARACKLFGMCERTYRAYINKPGKAATASLEFRRQVVAEFLKLCPFPLNSRFRPMRDGLTRLKSRPGSRELGEYLEAVEGLLLSCDRTRFADVVQVDYLLGVVNWSKAYHTGNNGTWFGDSVHWPAFAAECEKRLANSLCVVKIALADPHLDSEERTMIEELRPIIFLNYVCSILEQAKKGWGGRTLPEALTFLEEQDALAWFKKTAKEMPHIWQLVYDGLEFASLYKKEEDALWFYNELKGIDPGFQDFDYSPGEAPSIFKEMGMKWFHDKFRDQLHTANKPETSEDEPEEVYEEECDD